MAHIDAGKTTTTERILFHTGTIHKMGEVHEGTTTTDWMPQERERGITITSAAISCFWDSRGERYRVNLIDTPGHVDFTIEVERSLRVLDGAIAVFDGVNGVEPQSETVWRQADKHHVPRLCFINKMDRVGANFEQSVASIVSQLGATPLVLQLPIGREESFVGVVDLVRMRAYRFADEAPHAVIESDIPEDMADEAAAARQRLLDKVAELDDALMEKYLLDEGASFTEEELRRAIRRGCVGLKVSPVLCGAAYRDKGIQPLLDAVVDYLPSPTEVPPVQGRSPTGELLERTASDDAPFAALAFKLMAESFGTLTYLRVYSGRLNAGQTVWNPRLKRRERIGRLVQMRAEKRDEIQSCHAGDICAAVGLKSASTGDTFCAEGAQIILERIDFPEPVIQLALEPKSVEDAEGLGPALAKLSAEDPSFRVNVDPETGQTIISGMGELHLDIITDRLRREHRVAVVVGRPQVAYRETVTAVAEGEGEHVKQTAGKEQYGYVKLRVMPRAPGEGIAYRNALPDGKIPKEFYPAIEAGVMSSLSRGVVAGYSIVDVQAEVIDARASETDSDESSFQIAAATAFTAACKAASPTLLEPIMDVEVTTPQDYLGSVIGDISSRRGIIKSMGQRGLLQMISATVPLAEMFGYVDALRTLSQGRASYTMQFGSYAGIPEHILKPLLLRLRGY